MVAYKLDCKGQRCPKPIIQISRKMRELAVGDTLEVEADDPAFQPDLEAWLSTRQSELMQTTRLPSGARVILRRITA